MSDKNIYIDAKIVSTTVDTISKVLTTTVDTNSKLVTTAVDTNFKVSVVLSNMGEDSIPNPNLFKRTQDFYNVSDIILISIGYSRKLSSTFNATDTFSTKTNFNRSFKDYALSNDSYKTFKLSKNIINIFKANDTILNTVSFKRKFTDTIFPTDDFYGLANIDDDQIININKNLVSIINNQDIHSVYLAIKQLDKTSNTEQKYFKLIKPLLDKTTSYEQSIKILTKVNSDFLDNNDLAIINNTKVLLDNNTLIDTKYIYYDKVAKDIFSIIDTPVYTSTKVLLETTNIQDLISKSWEAFRNFRSTTLTRESNLFIIKPVYLELFSTIDRTVLNTKKNIQDTYITTDSINNVISYNRNIVDIVDAFDTFYGTAGAEDSQSTSFGKGIADYASTIEYINIFNSKPLYSNYTVSDIPSNIVYKNLLETLYNTDIIKFTNTKIEAESTALLDNTLLNIGNNYTDTVSISDSSNIVLVKVYTANVDTAAVYDVAYTDINKNLIDLIGSIDNIQNTVQYKRSISDSTNNTDIMSFITKPIISDIINISEIISRYQTKPIIDTSTASDAQYIKSNRPIYDYTISSDIISFYKFPNRFINDIITTNDGGIINNQSYFAESYAEPGYAGTNTYFS